MDRDRLRAYLDEGLSLIQIGELERRDPSTVGYWVQKHGLVANGRKKYAPKGGLTCQQLGPLVEQGLTLAEIAKWLDCSISTVRYWLAKHSLKTQGRRGRPLVPREVVDAVLRAGGRTLIARCRHHGETEFIVESSGRVRCKRCRMERVSEFRRTVKRTLVKQAGGACQLCGYDRYQGALQFHHLDPSQKEFVISRQGVTRAFAEAAREAAKCVLLCANCHAEVEAGYSSI
jgi:5-methylcytosine-specific restriction endonuclease McrA